MKNIFKVLLVASISIGTLIPSAVIATPITVTVSDMQFTSNPSTVHIQSIIPSVAEYVYSGAFSATASDSALSFQAWCIDIFQETNFHVAVADYQRKTAIEVVGAGKANLLLSLATESLGLVVDSRTSSAFQLAAWEIMNESLTTPLNLASGNFDAWGASDDSIALATTWLNNLPNSSVPNKYTISVLASATHQDFAAFTLVSELSTITLLPEPATIMLLAFGLFGIGLASRRKTTSVNR